jgi:hypothetical protein
VQYAQALTALTEARSKAAAILQQLAEAGPPDGAQDDEVLASLIVGLESQLENLDDDIERSSSLDELREAAARVAEAARRAALIRRRTDNLAVAETAKSVLRLTPGLWMDEGGFLVDLAAASAAADQELAGALKALEAARAEAEARRLVAGTAPRSSRTTWPPWTRAIAGSTSPSGSARPWSRDGSRVA